MTNNPTEIRTNALSFAIGSYTEHGKPRNSNSNSAIESPTTAEIVARAVAFETFLKGTQA